MSERLRQQSSSSLIKSIDRGRSGESLRKECHPSGRYPCGRGTLNTFSNQKSEFEAHIEHLRAVF